MCFMTYKLVLLLGGLGSWVLRLACFEVPGILGLRVLGVLGLWPSGLIAQPSYGLKRHPLGDHVRKSTSANTCKKQVVNPCIYAHPWLQNIGAYLHAATCVTHSMSRMSMLIIAKMVK